MRRRCGETSVLRSKTLPQGEFSSPEEVQSKGLPICGADWEKAEAMLAQGVAY
jgi:hypothetical protein